jgi:hypothetical protein
MQIKTRTPPPQAGKKRRAFLLGGIVSLASLLLLSGCSRLFPREAGPNLTHFEHEAPALGSAAPAITLSDLDGNLVELNSLLGEKPVVVQLGSYTCPVFRYRRFDMQPLRSRFQDQVDFLVLYTTEAHPVGSFSPYVDREWVPWHNRISKSACACTCRNGRFKNTNI